MQARGHRRFVSGQPGVDIAAPGGRIERTAIGQRHVDRTTAIGPVGPAGTDGVARIEQALRQRAGAGRQHRLDPLAHRLGQPGRGARRADRHRQRIAVDDGGRGEIAQSRPVDHIDQQPARFELRRIECGQLGILMRDDAERGVRRMRIVGNHRPGALVQPPLGVRHFAGAQQDDRAPAQVQKERKLAHRLSAASPARARRP